MHKVTKHNFVTITPNVNEGQSMIILGDRHKFSGMEIDQLGDRFDTIDHISYKNLSAEETIERIKNKVDSRNKSVIVLNTVARIPDSLLRYLTELEQKKGILYISVEKFLEKHLRKCYIPEDQTTADFLQSIRPLNIYQRFFKALIDYPAGVLLGAIYLASYPFVSRKTQSQSPGPTLFEQDRVGLNGTEFSCVKFRSMHTDAEKDGAQFTRENDERIFPWGDTMRRLRIDEIPQFKNILRGDMSLIGPRPERRVWVDQFEHEIPYYNLRHLVKPGITGWAQVMYPYGADMEDARQKLMYDLYYIKYWSPLLELRTIWKTIIVVLGKKGR